jgi:hypothetical protein
MHSAGIARLFSGVLACVCLSAGVLESQTVSLAPAGQPAKSLANPNQVTAGMALSALGNLPLQFERNEGQADRSARFLARGAGYSLLLNADGLALNLAYRSQAPARSVSMHLLGARAADIVGREKTPTQTNYYLGKDPGHWHLNVPTYRSVAYLGVYDGIDLIYHGNGSQLEYDFVVAPAADPNRIRMSFEGLRPQLRGHDLAFEGQDSFSLRSLKAFQVLNGERHEVQAKWEVSGDEAAIRLGAYDRSHELIIDPVFFYGTYVGGTASDAAVSIVSASQPGYFYVALSTASPIIQEPTQTSGTPATNPNVAGVDTLILGINATNAPAPPSGLPPFGGGPNGVPQPDPKLVIGSVTYIGGTTGTTKPTGMSADPNSNLYITGITTNAADFPQLGGQTCTPTCSGFIAKFATSLDTTSGSATLTLGYSFGLPANPLAIAVDTLGDAYLTGTATTAVGTEMLTVPASDLAFQALAAAAVGKTPGPHAFLLELDPAGATSFCSYIGGSGSDQGNAIAVSGNSVFIAGNTSSTDFPKTSGAYQPALGGGEDAFVLGAANLATSPALVFSTYLGGTGTDTASALAIAPSGNIVVGGATDSTAFPIQTSPSFSISSWPIVNTTTEGNTVTSLPTSPPTLVPLPTTVPAGAQDAFITSLSSDGTKLLFTDFLGGVATNLTQTMAQALTVDSLGVIYVTGSSTATAHLGDNPNAGEFMSGNATEDNTLFGGYEQGQSNVFFSEIDPTGKYLLEATLAGGSGTDQAGGLMISPPAASAGTVSIVGVTNGVSENPDFLLSAQSSVVDNLNGLDTLTKGSPSDTSGFFVQEALAGYCNMQLTAQVGTMLTFEGPCVSGTQAGTLFATPVPANGKGPLTKAVAVTASGTSLSGSVTIDVSSLASANIDFSFGFLPLGAVGGTGTCSNNTTSISGCGIQTSGGGAGTIFNVSAGVLTVTLSCPGANCTVDSTPNTALVGQPVTLNAAVINGLPNTVNWSSQGGTFSAPNQSTTTTFTPGGTGGPVVVSAAPVADPSLAPAPTITITTLEPTTVTFTSSGPFTYGQTSISLTVSSTNQTPTGSITYQVDGGGNSAPVPLSGGNATVLLNTLGAGSHNLVVNYPGATTSFLAASSNTLKFTVGAAPLTVTAASPSITFGQPIPKLTYTITGFVNGDASSVVTGTALLTTTATSTSPPGLYPITFTAEGLAASNYTFSYVPGNLTINAVGAVPLPIITPAGGVFTTPQTATIADTLATAKIYYTTDGSVPTTSSTIYIGPISVAASQTIRAIGVAPGYTNSQPSNATFTLSPPMLSSSTISFGSIVKGTSSAAQSVVLTNQGANALSGLTLTLGGSNIGDFSFGAPTTCGATLAAGSNCSVAVIFTPSLIGAESGALQFAYAGIGAPQTVSLVGTGLGPLAITSTATQLVAGTTFQFTASAPATWTSSAGTMTAGGFFTAPNPPPAPAMVTITATLIANPQVFVTEQIAVASPPAITVPSNTTLPAGGTSTVPISIVAGTGISGESLALACAPATLPTGIGCSFVPNPVVNAAGATITLQLFSTTQSAQLPKPRRPWQPLGGSAIVVASCLWFFGRRNSGRKAITFFALILATAALLSLSACGTSGSFNTGSQGGKVTGTYTIDIDITGASQDAPDYNQTLAAIPLKVTLQ